MKKQAGKKIESVKIHWWALKDAVYYKLQYLNVGWNDQRTNISVVDFGARGKKKQKHFIRLGACINLAVMTEDSSSGD